MILQFNDGNTIEIESFGKNEDLSILSFFLYTEDFNMVKEMFMQKERLSAITIGTDTYSNYTTLKSMTADMCEDGRIYVSVQLAYAGLDEQLSQLEEKNEVLKNEMFSVKNENKNLSDQIEILTGCILEMSELLYS